MPWRPSAVAWKVQEKRYTPGRSRTTAATPSAGTRSGVRQLPSVATALWAVRPRLGNRTLVPAGTRVTSRAKKLSYMGTLTVPRGSPPPEHPASTAPARASAASRRPCRVPWMAPPPGMGGTPVSSRSGAGSRQRPRYAAAVMKLVKTSIRLADGRELLYFDEREGIDRRARDTRDLAPAVTSSQIRCDPLSEEWVIVASHRQGRTHLPPADQCPLCPSRDGRATEIPAADYDVVVFENRFPSLASDPGRVADAGPFARRPGVGRCEVVCFTSDHGGALARLPVGRIRTVVEVWADRTLELGAMDGVEQVFPFENRGEEIGVTLHHPHGQIYAYPFVAPRTARQLDVARAHREATGGCRTCSIVAAEAEGERVVATVPGWLAVVPFAARWPFEVHLYPTRHLPDLPALDDGERDGLAVLLKDVLGRFDGLFDQPLPYMLICHQAPVRRDRDLAHAHLEAFSIRRTATKLKYLASSESGAGVFINDIAPERAAELLRAATSRTGRTGR